MSPPVTPDDVRALLNGAGPEDWRAINGVDDPDPAWGSFPMVVTEPSGASDDGGDEVAIVRNRSNGDAAMMAASKRIALAYLDAVSERDRLREIADDSPPPADAGLLALANRTLAADLETVRAERDRLARVLAVEGGDESAAPPGWMRPYGGRSWANAGPGVRPQWQVVQEHDGTWWYIYVNNGRHFSKERLKFALEAMEAADRAGGSDV